MLTLHYLEDSRSHRILWMLEELQIPYEIKVYRRDPKTNLGPESFKQVHPAGKFPVVTQDDYVIAESGAIVEYLAQNFGDGRFLPNDTDTKLAYTYWMHYAEGSLMPLLVMKQIFRKALETPMPFFIKPIIRILPDKIGSLYLDPTLGSHLDFVNEHLGTVTWLCGDQLTGADFLMSFPLEGVMVSNPTLAQQYPNIRRYVKQFQARDAYKSALEKAGLPYAYRLSESS